MAPRRCCRELARQVLPRTSGLGRSPWTGARPLEASDRQTTTAWCLGSVAASECREGPTAAPLHALDSRDAVFGSSPLATAAPWLSLFTRSDSGVVTVLPRELPSKPTGWDPRDRWGRNLPAWPGLPLPSSQRGFDRHLALGSPQEQKRFFASQGTPGDGKSQIRPRTQSTSGEDAQSRRRGKGRGSRAAGAGSYAFPEVDAEKIVRELEAADEAKDRAALTAQERGPINKLLKHFAESGWAADQALAIYINSSFFPAAASKFRRFVLRTVTGELKDILLAAGEPSHETDKFLFSIFAEYCFDAFAAEIKSFRALVDSADMTKPETWYPYARALKRRVVYHMGPTNSGKTHQALERFKQAGSGIYCGPLRLLAMEVFDRVNADGVYCNLTTGQERKEVPFAQHTACTIEMANLFTPVDVAIIDEIQMINDEYRGWAWTRALLGMQATEVHVCGDPSALGILQSLCAATGDELVCASYSRFAPLTVDQTSLGGSLSGVQPGDCVVAFSRREIFEIKRQIEVMAGQRCCVVYGALPPETRRQQALLFNEEGSGFDVLVASDAVGMGLNLNIRRIVFSTLAKFNGDAKMPIPAPMVKQIAGRAGRRGSKYEEGVVTCLFESDIPQLLSGLQEEVQPLQEVGLFPVFEQVELFASQLPEMTFSQLLNRFVTTSRVDGQYFICRTDNLLKVANLLDKVKGLSLKDRFQFCFAPANTQDPAVMTTLLQYAQSFAEEQPVQLNLPNSSVFTAAAAARARANAAFGVPPPSPFSFELMALEGRHQIASMYLWLAQHFPPQMFPDTALATSMAQGAAKDLAQTLLKPMDQSKSSSGWTAIPETLKQVGRGLRRDRKPREKRGLERDTTSGKDAVEEGSLSWVALSG